jgi:chemotaxis regulatin CheY-phosphate phosphatase CheZ
MILRVTVTGGWSGLEATCVIDTASLTALVAQNLEHAFIDCVSLDLPEAPKAARDTRTYIIEVRQGACSRVLQINERAAPAQAAQLLKVIRPLCNAPI